MFNKNSVLPTKDTALPGRDLKIAASGPHFVLGSSAPFPTQMRSALFGLGCFWGAEKRFWEQSGVHYTEVGYSAGITPNPTYEEVCSGLTGHNEVVSVIFDPKLISYGNLLSLFWESHNPTQGMRQGNDAGTQYRSGIYTFSNEQLDEAEKSKVAFQQNLNGAGYSEITTEILPAQDFYLAEEYHQQYLAKVPNGYCGIGGTGVCYTDTLVRS